VPPGLANTVTSILRGVLTINGATGTSDVLTGHVAAAKTGTVDNYEGSWFAGYTPQLAASAWVGVPSNPIRSLEGLTFGGRYYDYPVFGATVAGKIWQSTMNAALLGEPDEQFTGPSEYYSIGVSTPVPDVTGDEPGNAEATLTQDGFHPQIVAGTVASSEQLGTVARTSPPAGASESTGAVIKIYLSNGTPAPRQTPPPPNSSPSGKPSSPPTTPPTSHPGHHGHHGHHHR